MSSLPTIAILATGGTIAGSADDSASAARYRAGAVPIDQLLAASKLGLERIANVRAEQVAQIDSKDLTFDVWERLVARIRHWIDVERVDGVVITHGTDTLEETAMLLHLVLQTDMPIVMTAAMRPSTSLSADGPLNLLNAVRAAASPASRGRGVLVALNQRVHAARDVQKGTPTLSRRLCRRTSVRLASCWTPQCNTSAPPSCRPRLTGCRCRLSGNGRGSRYCRATLSPMRAWSTLWWRPVCAGWSLQRRGGSIHANLEAALQQAVKRGVIVLRSTRTGPAWCRRIPTGRAGHRPGRSTRTRRACFCCC